MLAVDRLPSGEGAAEEGWRHPCRRLCNAHCNNTFEILRLGFGHSLLLLGVLIVFALDWMLRLQVCKRPLP